jgi:hypothetical protein
MSAATTFSFFFFLVFFPFSCFFFQRSLELERRLDSWEHNKWPLSS